MKRALLVLLCATLLLTIQANAQEDDTQAILDNINTAYANFAALTSYGVTVEQDLSQNFYDVASDGLLVSMTINQQIEAQIIVGSPTTLSTTLSQDLTLEMPAYALTQIMNTTAETRLIDGAYYLRFGENDYGLPTYWVNMNEDAALVPGAEIYDIEALSNVASFAIPTQAIEASMIDSLRELPAEMQDGQKLRGFELVWNPDIVRATDMFSLSSVLNLEALGGNTEQFVEEYLANLTFSQQIWIGVEDNLPHRITATLTVGGTLSAAAVEGGPLDFDQVVKADNTYHSFNAEFAINPPNED